MDQPAAAALLTALSATAHASTAAGDRPADCPPGGSTWSLLRQLRCGAARASLTARREFGDLAVDALTGRDPKLPATLADRLGAGPRRVAGGRRRALGGQGDLRYTLWQAWERTGCSGAGWLLPSGRL
ncbi:MAG: hypothetical protein H6522_05785 [Mycolicibacterium sp.]|nr:hypothetical protein [Mycolicibacterium sp.]